MAPFLPLLGQEKWTPTGPPKWAPSSPSVAWLKMDPPNGTGTRMYKKSHKGR